MAGARRLLEDAARPEIGVQRAAVAARIGTPGSGGRAGGAGSALAWARAGPERRCCLHD